MLAVLVMALVNGAPADDELLARAEAAFAQGVEARAKPEEAKRHFAAAADAYQGLRERGAGNPDLYRNLGNASLLAGRVPEAVLAYRQGLHIAPSDAGLREGLEQARDRVEYPPGAARPAGPFWPPWLPRPASWVLLTLASVGYALGCIAFTRWRMTSRRRTLWLAGGAFAAALVSAAGWCWLLGTEQAQADQPLVVVAAAETPLHAGNGESYPRHETLPALRRGMEARLLFRRGDWLQVRLPGGDLGWVRGEHVLIGD